MVNFCLYLNSNVIRQTNLAALAAIQALRLRLKSKAVNHTDYHILRNHPIALSIKSKTQDGSMAAAALQVGTWQAAHWKFHQKLLAARGLDVGTLDFLPGLIVQGLEWYFVATTNVDGAKMLWMKQFIGLMMTAIGTYQVIWAIQTLAAWCANEYWAWFRVNVLELDEEPG
ncbi:hypothetical protein K456DRAFT_1947379 [Colletotrichum gloeosporioides 23]|nr:hypothetical protein K456DRAFT_1947379 [Colletotrichum gloeosporioides 23]